jgi:hypothetical protein
MQCCYTLINKLNYLVPYKILSNLANNSSVILHLLIFRTFTIYFFKDSPIVYNNVLLRSKINYIIPI